MRRVKVLILRTAGTNCDKETAFAFGLVGAVVELVHINELISAKKKMANYHILAIPGGFTYGDDIASGKILANELRFKLGKDLEKFIKDGKLIIGICNGFQVLVKAGLLPGSNSGLLTPDSGLKIQATLTLNDSGKFEDRWTYLRVISHKSQVTSHKSPLTTHHSPITRCIWTKNLPEIIYLPVAHGEGKFIPKNEDIRQKLWNNGHVVLQYVDEQGNLTGYPVNPNGSIDNIAGICDNTGRIFGLMPHPERHIRFTQHPRWARVRRTCDVGRQTCNDEGDGLQIFRNAVNYAKNNL